MATPQSNPGLLERIRRSGLVPVDRLNGFLDGLRASGNSPATTRELLNRLIDAGMITQFQADKLAAGKYKGFQIGSYLILDQIGSGGMGQVYLAEHTSMRRLVALKVFPPYASDDDVAKERFLREARAAAALDHPNIVRAFDLCQEGRLLYLVMEYVEGISLQSLVTRSGPLEITAACHYARQIAFGLQHAHELGFVHRDIKPGNLLLDRSGVVRILDLGLVRSESDADSGLTAQLDSKSILGTADYVAPEQAVDSSNVDIRADLYSLGATIYFMLTGRTLFPEGRTAQKLIWQRVKEPIPIQELRATVPDGVAEVIHKLLEKEPARRYATPLEVFDALAEWDVEEVPPPDESVLPKTPARVQASRSAMSASGTRVPGSTSQILTLAMRSTGSSSVGMNATRRPGASGVITTTPPPRRNPDSSETNAMQREETLSKPRQEPERKQFPWAIAIVMTLVAAAAGAITAFAILG